MGARTRSATSSPAKKEPVPSASPSKQPPRRNDPHHLLIVPDNLSTAARILVLPSPRDKSKKRFLFCPVKGLYEFTKVAAPPSDLRSLLFARANSGDSLRAVEDRADYVVSDGYVQKDATFLVATPFDMMFLLVPLLPSLMVNAGKILFQPLDDLFESQTAEDTHLRYVINNGKSIVEEAMARFCDSIEAGGDKMFRLNEDKLAKLIHSKAHALVSSGLPASMEEKFVTRALEAPISSVKRDESTTARITRESSLEDLDTKSDSFDSQSTAANSATASVFSEISIASSATTVVPQSPPPDITILMRLKVALDFILASYLPQPIADYVRTRVSESKAFVDFAPLEAHLKHLASLKAEALASRSFGDFSRKRGNAEDDETAEERVEKKRKLEEEEKRKKANQSRGVKELSKVNVTGMKKMSDFFAKKPVTAKAKA